MPLKRGSSKKTKCLFPEGESTQGMVSVSQLQSFMSCPKKWSYGYVENLTPRVEKTYLTVGKLCHKAMQVAMDAAWVAQRRDTPEDETDWHDWKNAGLSAMRIEWCEYMENTPMTPEEEQDMHEALHTAASVFTQAFKEFRPWRYEVLTVFDGKKEYPALELHFLVPCAGSKGLHGFIDAILKDKETGLIWCTDYKFRKTLSPDEDEEVNIQNTVYTHACKKMGINITGTMTWQHVNTAAADPAILKNGSVSRAKIKTTWDHYAAFVLDHGGDPATYETEMKEKLADIEWFRVTHEFRNEETVKNMWNKIIVPAAYAVKSARTAASRGLDLKRQMYPWNCKMCQYRSLCQAELRNYDADFLRETAFVERSPHGNDIIDTANTPVVQLNQKGGQHDE